MVLISSIIGLTQFFLFDRTQEKTVLNELQSKVVCEMAYRLAYPHLDKKLELVEFRKRSYEHSFIFSDGSITLSCDAVTGEVRSIIRSPSREELKKAPISRKEFFLNPIEAQKQSRSLLEHLGLPKSAVLLYFYNQGPMKPARDDSLFIGTLRFRFGLKSSGYGYRHGFNQWECELNWHNGQVDYLAIGEKAKPVSSKKVLTQSQATAIAVQMYPKLKSERRPKPKPRKNANLRVMLKFVVPNGEYGGTVRPPVNRVFESRLAWIVIIGPDEVWIDAGDGKLLGGWMRGFLDSHTEYYKNGIWTPNDY